jgi:hypothetical protein
MWLIGALLFDFYLDMIELLMSGVRAYAPEETYEWFSRLYFHGPLFWTYFLFQLALGVVVPLVALATRRGRASIVNSGVMAVLVLMGVYMMRWNVVAGGQMASKVTNDIVSYPLVWTGYDSVQTVLGVFGVAFLLFLLFAWIFPWKAGFEGTTEPAVTPPAAGPVPTTPATTSPANQPTPVPSTSLMGVLEDGSAPGLLGATRKRDHSGIQ